MTGVMRYLAPLAPEPRAMIDTLRAIVVAAAPQLSERADGDGVHFACSGAVRISLAAQQAQGVQVALNAICAPVDTERSADWSSGDGGVIAFADCDAIVTVTPALFRLFRACAGTAC